jgi:hypothetical protein
MESSLVDNNYDLIEEAEYFEELHIDYEVWWFGVVCMVGWFCVGCGWGRELVL